MDLKAKLKHYQEQYEKAVKELQRLDTVVKQFEGAIYACQEMIKEEEEAKKKKT